MSTATCIAYCWRTGRIDCAEGTDLPEGAIEIARAADLLRLRDWVDLVARHGYQAGLRLVPGVPEAESDEEASDALAAFLQAAARMKAGRRHGVAVNLAGAI